MPAIYALCVVGVLIVGIIIGSFLDFQFSNAIKNVNDIGSFFATYGSYLPFCLYPAAGMCLFKALKKQGKGFIFLAWLLLILSYFLAVYYSDHYNGTKVRALFGTFEGDTPFYVSFLSWLFWIVLYSWVPVVFYFILDEANPKLLLAVGITILVSGVLADLVNVFLKQVASRPRFKYLLTLQDPMSKYRNWWQWIPYKAGTNDLFKSWPSGNMSIASYMFSLPLLLGCVKKTNNVVKLIAFIFAACFVILYGYNRIHMTNHFLSDVCFGTLFSYLIFGLIDFGCQKLVTE